MKKNNKILWIVGIIVVGIVIFNQIGSELFATIKPDSGNTVCSKLDEKNCMLRKDCVVGWYGCIDLANARCSKVMAESIITSGNKKYTAKAICKKAKCDFVKTGKDRKGDYGNCVIPKKCERIVEPEDCMEREDCVVGWYGCINLAKAKCKDIQGEFLNKQYPHGGCAKKPGCTVSKDGSCKNLNFIPNCNNKFCGSDGGGGSCGDCSTSTLGSTCNSKGECSYHVAQKDKPLSKDFTTIFDTYNMARKKAGILDKYLYETTLYDYNTLYKLPEAGNLKNEILLMSDRNPKRAAQIVVKSLNNRISYDLSVVRDESGSPWFQRCPVMKASEIYKSGKGICSTMSRTTVAMLRGIGLAARTSTGCVGDLTSVSGCYPVLWSIFGNTPVFINSYQDPSGRYVIAGRGLHTWVEVWLPETGWTIIEATGGGYLPNEKCKPMYYTLAIEDNYNDEIDVCGMSPSKAKKCEEMD